jgi:iron complex outermembrane receptor protein
MQYSRSKAATLQVQVNNVFNTVYQSALSRLKYFEYYTSVSNGRPGIYGMGINVSVRLTVPF